MGATKKDQAEPNNYVLAVPRGASVMLETLGNDPVVDKIQYDLIRFATKGD